MHVLIDISNLVVDKDYFQFDDSIILDAKVLSQTIQR